MTLTTILQFFSQALGVPLLFLFLLTACKQPAQTQTSASATTPTPVVSVPLSSPYAANAPTSDTKLQEDSEAIAKVAGKKLSMSFEMPDDLEYTIDDAQLTPLGAGHFLFGYEGKLIRLNEKQQQVWSYEPSWKLFDFHWVKDTNLIYGTASDNTMFVLNATTGKELYRISRNGSASYGAIVPYGKDGVLITEPRETYRERNPSILVPDQLEAWKGRKRLWEIEIPPGTDIKVAGEKIYAVTKTKRAVYLKELFPPKSDNTAKPAANKN